MKGFARIAAVIFFLGIAAASAVFWLRWRGGAAASEPVFVEEPAPPIYVKPELASSQDPRLYGLTDRGDGAALLWSPEPGETLLRAAFVDNLTLIATATSTSSAGPVYRLYALDLQTRRPSYRLESANERFASNHRPANKNAEKLCFSQRGTGGTFEIWCSEHDGSDPRQLTTHDGREDLFEPAISPDGASVAFEVSDRSASTIWKIGLNGAGLQQLTRGADDRFPTWSEDGRRIFFQRRPAGGPTSPDGLRGASRWDAYVMLADGTNPTPVLRTFDEDEKWPTIRPGFDEIVYASGTEDGATRIKRLDAETKAGTWLTSGETGGETFPSVSPDGKLISFLAPIDVEHPATLGVWLKEIE